MRVWPQAKALLWAAPRRSARAEPRGLCSRCCAYALGLVDYIVETTEPDNPAWDPSPSWQDDIARFCAHTRFLRLGSSMRRPPTAH